MYFIHTIVYSSVSISCAYTCTWIIISMLLLYSPINFLNPRHRVIYMLAFGVIGSQLASLLVNSSSLTTNQWGAPIVQCKTTVQ